MLRMGFYLNTAAFMLSFLFSFVAGFAVENGWGIIVWMLWGPYVVYSLFTAAAFHLMRSSSPPARTLGRAILGIFTAAALAAGAAFFTSGIMKYLVVHAVLNILFCAGDRKPGAE